MTGYLDWLLLQETFGTLEIPYAIANRYIRRIRRMTDVILPIIWISFFFLSKEVALFLAIYGYNHFALFNL